jgi:ubiquitin carboxyl-terminal hydrolase 7
MEQQDSQEFWKLLLPALECPQLVDLYQGAYEDYITAVDGSGRERRREEPFLDLSLEVTCGSLLESMKDMFGTPELLSEKEGNGWRPEKGQPKVDALKGSLLRVAGLPSLLQCHLKRFQYDWQTDVMSKVNDKFTFPKELDLSCVCTDVKPEEEASCLYDLQAVVVHAGEYGSGHYYAYVRPDIRSDDWYRFNDHEVTKVSFQDVANDSYGGQAVEKAATERKRGLLSRVFGRMNSGSFGYGGKTSSAYMLQYVRRRDIPKLYNEDNQ